MRTVRIANAGGYWGDDPDALRRQVEGGPIDYLTADYLAEITMAILQKMAAKDPSLGYATDFVPAAAAVLPALLEKKIRLVANAGGVNPAACAEALRQAAAKKGLAPRIAVVDGSAFDAREIAPSNLDTGAPFSEIAARYETAYAYLGARPIADALARGADVVITGRVADASLTLGPLVHEFGWAWDDWDRLAAATVAGHVLECGAQASGGNLTDWARAPNLAHVGYPIAEVDEAGGVVITKHPGTGGAVTRESVVEQLLYEIGNPEAYATPDVTVDFTSFDVSEAAPDRVRITGVRGLPPPPTLKAGLSHSAGWKCAGTFLFGPPDAVAKARAMAEIVWARAGTAFEETYTEILGGLEVFLRLGVRDFDRRKVEAFSRRFASFALSGPPGVTIPGGGRPPVVEVFGFWPAAVPRETVRPVVLFEGETIDISPLAPSTRPLPLATRSTSSATPATPRNVPLLTLAFARSGDKGDGANIGVAARSAEAYAHLRGLLTPEFVKSAFAEECRGEVVRHELPNLRAFNFVLTRALGGGGIVSLRSDPQGKTFAQRLLATLV